MHRLWQPREDSHATVPEAKRATADSDRIGHLEEGAAIRRRRDYLPKSWTVGSPPIDCGCGLGG
jgi:hypothetical protein